ncbi:MAG: jacalin-like lectin [Sphingomonadaceae bacterium]
MAISRQLFAILPALLITSIFLFSGPAHAGSSERFGGSGGSSFTIACPGIEKISGIRVQSGALIDGLSIACDPGTRTTSSFTGSDGSAGSSGGSREDYTLVRGRFLRHVTISWCEHRGRTSIRSIRFQYYIAGQQTTNMSKVYGRQCNASSGSGFQVLIAPPGQHIYGFYGKSGSRIDSIGIMYRPIPLTGGRNITIPAGTVMGPLNANIFSRLRVTLDSLGAYGRQGGYVPNNSTIRFNGPNGAVNQNFAAIPEMTYRRDNGRYRVDAYLNDFSTSRINLRALQTAFQLDIDFETDGREIKGFCRVKKIDESYRLCAGEGDKLIPDAHIENPRAQLRMVPARFSGLCDNEMVNSIVLVPAGAQATGTLKIAGDRALIPDVLENWVKNTLLNRIFRQMIEDKGDYISRSMEAGFRESASGCAMATLFRDRFLAPLNIGQINAVGMRNGQIVVEF